MRSECPALLPEAIELESDEPLRAHMVWLHGLGADGHDLAPVAEMLGISGIHHVLPHAPVRPVTLNGGAAMRAWYDIATPDLRWREDAAGMQASAQAVRSLIEALRNQKALPVILAGFSQGAVVSLATAALGVELHGVAALSGYVPAYLTGSLENLSRTPVFMGHGRQDTVIPLALAKLGAETLVKSGVTLEWHEYDMPHAISLQEINDLRAAITPWLDGSDGA